MLLLSKVEESAVRELSQRDKVIYDFRCIKGVLEYNGYKSPITNKVDFNIAIADGFAAANALNLTECSSIVDKK